MMIDRLHGSHQAESRCLEGGRRLGNVQRTISAKLHLLDIPAWLEIMRITKSSFKQSPGEWGLVRASSLADRGGVLSSLAVLRTSCASAYSSAFTILDISHISLNRYESFYPSLRFRGL